MRRVKIWLAVSGMLIILLFVGASAKQVAHADTATSVTSYFDSKISDANLTHSGGSDTSSSAYKNGANMVNAAEDQGVYPALSFDSVTASKMRTTNDGSDEAIDPTATLTFTIKAGTTAPNPFPSGLNDIGRILLVFSFPNSVSGKNNPTQWLPSDSAAVKINGSQTGFLNVGDNADVSQTNSKFTVNRDLIVTVDLNSVTQELAKTNGVSESQVSPRQVVVSQQFLLNGNEGNWYKVQMGTLAFTLTLTPDVSSIIVLPDTALAKKLFGDDTYAVVIGKGALSGDSIYYSTSDLDPNAAVGGSSWQATDVTVGKNGTWVWHVPKGVMSSANSKLYFTERSNNATDTAGGDDGAGTDPFAGLNAQETETGLNHLHDVTETLSDPNSDPADVDDALNELNDVLNPDTTSTTPTDKPDDDVTDPDFSLDLWRSDAEITTRDTVANILFMPTINDNQSSSSSMVIGAFNDQWGITGKNTTVLTDGTPAKWEEFTSDSQTDIPDAKRPITISARNDGSLNADLIVNSDNLTAKDYENGLSVTIKISFTDAVGDLRTMTRTIHLLALTPQTAQLVAGKNSTATFKLNDPGVASLAGATYQWQREAAGSTQVLSSETASSLTVSNVTTANNGDRYRLIINKNGKTYTSGSVVLTVVAETGITQVPDFDFKMDGKDPNLADLIGAPTAALTANGSLSFRYGESGNWSLLAQLGDFVNQNDQSNAEGVIGMNLAFSPNSDPQSTAGLTLQKNSGSFYVDGDGVDFLAGTADGTGGLMTGDLDATLGMSDMTQLKPGEYDATITWTLGSQEQNTALFKAAR